MSDRDEALNCFCFWKCLTCGFWRLGFFWGWRLLKCSNCNEWRLHKMIYGPHGGLMGAIWQPE